MSFGDDIVNGAMRVLWLSAKVGFKLAGLAVGTTLNYVTSRMGRYRPKYLAGVEGSIPQDHIGVLTVKLPRTTEWDEAQALHLMSHLAASFSEFGLQITADHDGITWQIVMWLGSPEQLEQAVLAHYPGAKLDFALKPYQAPTKPYYRIVLPWQLGTIFPAPIATVDQIKQFDPLDPLTQAMSQLQAGERVSVTLAVLGMFPEAAKAGDKLITGSDVSALEFMRFDGAGFALIRKMRGFDRQAKYTYELDQVMRDKLGSPLCHAVLLLQVDAPTQDRAEALMDQIAPHLYNFANPPFNSLLPLPRENAIEGWVKTQAEAFDRDSLGVLNRWLSGVDEGWRECLLILEPAEVAATWHLPHRDLGASSIHWHERIEVPAPKAITRSQPGVLIGQNQHGNHQQPVYLPLSERLTHTTILGKTGMGKSSLAHWLIHEDIAAGRGVMVITPHPGLVSDLLQHSIPKGREDDVVILDLDQQLNQVHYPCPLNLLGRIGGQDSQLAIGRLLNILETLYPNLQGKRMGEHMRNVLATAAAEPQPNLLTLRRLLRDPQYRQTLIDRSSGLVVREFWEDFAVKKPTEQRTLLEPLTWRLRGFYNSEPLLAITCHPKPLDLGELMRQNKIILVSLKADERVVPATERRVLGAALLAEVELIALSGVLTSPAPYTVYVDEAQHFVTTALPEMLSEVRKFNLGLVLINQFLDQLAGETEKALLGNVGTLIGFELGDKDAKALASYMKPGLTSDQLVRLGQYRAAVSTRVNQTRLDAFTLETQPPPGNGKSHPKREAELRRKSIENYTPMPYSEVMTAIHQAYTNPIQTGGDDLFE